MLKAEDWGPSEYEFPKIILDTDLQEILNFYVWQALKTHKIHSKSANKIKNGISFCITSIEKPTELSFCEDFDTCESKI